MTQPAATTAEGAAPAGEALAAVFPGASEMARRCRALDWAATPLGPVAGWPASLRAVAGLVLAAPVGMIVLWGPELVQLYNDAYRDVMGDKHPAGLGQRTRDCWPEVWSFNAPLYAGVMERGETFTFTDQRLELERHGRREEAYFTLAFSGVPDDAGRVGGVLVTVAETTAQVRGRAAEVERSRLATAIADERAGVLEEVFRRSPSFLHVLRGPDFVFEFANDAYHRLVGRRDLVGHPAFAVLPEAAAGGFPERIARVMATGEPFEGRELPVMLARTPGAPPEERLVDLVYLPLLEADGTCARVLGHGIDVTEHVRARRATEAALAERTAAAEEANRAKSEFLAVMSHELRTPLNAIGGYAQLMELGLYGPVTSEQLATLSRIQRGQQHLLGLIDAVLNYAKLEAGRVEYHPVDVPAAELIAEVAALVAPQARAKGLGLAVRSADAAARLVARADPEKVRQILLNLLSNAVKFTRGGGTVTIACAPAPSGEGGPRVAITVVDTGRGIAPDQLERVFEPFVQVDQRLTRAEGGTGLGLAISRDLARGMGGDLTADSTPGVGSAFTLTLPGA